MIDPFEAMEALRRGTRRLRALADRGTYWNDLQRVSTPHGPAWIRRRDLAELIGEGQAVAADLEIEPEGGHT